jgi:hypothetical protein
LLVYPHDQYVPLTLAPSLRHHRPGVAAGRVATRKISEAAALLKRTRRWRGPAGVDCWTLTPLPIAVSGLFHPVVGVASGPAVLPSTKWRRSSRCC